MQAKTYRTLLLFALGAVAAQTGCGEPTPFETTRVPLRQRCSTQASVVPAAAAAVIDGDPSTGYGPAPSSRAVTIDLGCPLRISGLRRKMSVLSSSRGWSSENISISSDGQSWTPLSNSTTTGWGHFSNFVGRYWAFVSAGWTPWLRINQPTELRYIRYAWVGATDRLDEIEVDTRVASASASPLSGTPDAVLDGNTGTGFRSSSNNWQYLQVDLGEQVHITALRRHMTGSHPNRRPQGETWSVSQDGLTWSYLEAPDVEGWESYVQYRSFAWHSVDYGWSDWLALRQPTRARYLRFGWDGDGDSLDEVEISRTMVSRDPSYDFDPVDPTHTVSRAAFAPSSTGGIIISPTPSTPYDLVSQVGLTGMYYGKVSPRSTLRSGYCSGGGNRSCTSGLQCRSGEVCLVYGPPVPPPNVTAPTRGVDASLWLTQSGPEARGYLRINQPGLVYQGGSLCGETALDVGTELPVRMRTWTHDGRFSGVLRGYRTNASPYAERFMRGESTREVDRFLFSGTVRTTFSVGASIRPLQRTGLYGFQTGTNLHGTVEVDMPAPCGHGYLTLSFERADGMLMRGLGW